MSRRMSPDEVAREARELELAMVAFRADSYEPRFAEEFWKVATPDERRRYRAIAVAVAGHVEAEFDARLEGLEAKLCAVFTPANHNEWRARK